MDRGMEAYQEIRYLYIDDPVSSLDEHNAISVAHHLAQLLKRTDHQLKTVVSSHHALFFNVMCNELPRAVKLFLSNKTNPPSYILRPTGETPFFQHIAMLVELQRAIKNNELYTYHFSILRNILERTSSFHGFDKFSECITIERDDSNARRHARFINVLNHGNHSLFSPVEMSEEYKDHFKMILAEFRGRYPFNEDLFADADKEN